MATAQMPPTYAQNPKPGTLHPKPSILNPIPYALNPKPNTLGPMGQSSELEGRHLCLHDGHRTGVAEEHLDGGGCDGGKVEGAQLTLLGIQGLGFRV